jgi:hypothetical protein
LPYETVLFARGRAGVRSTTLELLDRQSAVRAAEFGVLQRTPMGPIYIGLALEEERLPYYFVQVGHELLRRVFF